MVDAPAFRALVTEDGRYVLPHYRQAFAQHVAQLAGHEVEIIVRRPAQKPTRRQRGYWRAVIVPAFQEVIGEPSKWRAHKRLLDVLDWMPGDPDPSTADEACDRERQSDLIMRACALLVTEGVEVDEPEPDPVKRWERRRLSA